MASVTGPLTGFDVARQALFLSVKENYEKQMGEYNRQVEDMFPAFLAEVNKRNHQFQHPASEQALPDLAGLQSERRTNVEAYWRFVTLTNEIGELGHQLMYVAKGLTPRARTYCTEAELRVKSPELSDAIVKSDAASKEILAKVEEWRVAVTGLHTKAVSLVYNTTYAVQRLCQHVDRGGQPLSFVERGANFATAKMARVPTLAELDRPKSSSVNLSASMPAAEGLTASGASALGETPRSLSWTASAE